MEPVRELTYTGDSVSAGGGCETAVTVRTRGGWVELGNMASYSVERDSV